MRKKIVFWLKKKVAEAKAKGVCFGLSGGLDSCVVAALAKEALGTNRVLALILPCHSQEQHLLEAKAFARKFKIRTKLIDLSKTYDSLVKVLPAADRLTQANIPPRLRMAALYYFAKKLNYLVCGTSNKSELMAGYFTKFGDGASDILPLGCLYKTQVRCLARELNIPQEIIAKPPTAGLWPGQTDEGEMGIKYQELDDVLARFELGKKQIFSKQKAAKVKRMVAASAHKRRTPAICAL